MLGFKRKGVNYFVASCFYKEIFVVGVKADKLFEALRFKVDQGTQGKANHGICFEYGDTDSFEKLIVFGQGYARLINLKYE